MSKVGKQAEGGRNRARAGWAGQGVRASWQEGAGGEGTLRAKRGSAPGCELPDGATQNTLICFYFIPLQSSINILLQKHNLNALNN